MEEKNPYEKSGKFSRIALIIFGTIAILQLGVIGYIFKDEISNVLASVVSTEEEGLTYPLEAIQVNLAGDSGSNYLKATFHLGYSSKKDLKEIEGSLVEIQSTVIETVRSKTLEEINTVDKTEALSTELKKQINEILESEVISDIYILEFLYQ